MNCLLKFVLILPLYVALRVLWKALHDTSCVKSDRCCKMHSLKQCEFVWEHCKWIHQLLCFWQTPCLTSVCCSLKPHWLLSQVTTGVSKSTETQCFKSSFKETATASLYWLGMKSKLAFGNYLSMRAQSRRSLQRESGWMGPEIEGRCWPVCRRTQSQSESFKLDYSLKTGQIGCNRWQSKLTHMVLALWVWLTHHLQREQNKNEETHWCRPQQTLPE